MSVERVGGRIVVRPRSPTDLRRRGAYALPFLPLALLGVLHRTVNGYVIAGGLVMVPALLACYTAGTWVWADETRIGRVVYAVWRRSLERGLVASLLRVDIAYASTGPAGRRLLFLDASGRCRMKAFVDYSSEGDIRGFADALGLPLDDRGYRSARRLRDEVPGSVSWWGAHYWITACLVLAAALLLAAVGAGVFGAVRG